RLLAQSALNNGSGFIGAVFVFLSRHLALVFPPSLLPTLEEHFPGKTFSEEVPVSTAAPSTKSGPQPAEILMQIATGHMVASALYGVLSVGIPDLLKSGSKRVV